MKIGRSPSILVCPDSFKGSLSSFEAARSIEKGVKSVLPGARITILPLADGGEGTLLTLRRAGGRLHYCRVTGPLGGKVRAAFLTMRRTAVIEMAQAAGLLTIPPGRRDPMKATTWGVGEIIDKALSLKPRKIIVTLGGSATVDGGAGMAQALGARLMDARGKPVPAGGAGLLKLARVDLNPMRNKLQGVRVFGATDVRNPLLGPRGAARVFGPQKGATPRQVRLLERGLANFSLVCARDLRRKTASIPGAGAAGGLGAGLVAFLGAKLLPGAGLIFDLVGFDRILSRSDLVLTGEGHLDRQTAMGKLVAAVAARARTARVPVAAFAGKVSLGAAEIRGMGLAKAYPITPPGMSARESFAKAGKLLERAAARAAAELSRS